jgi:hypothetical protein
MSGRRQQGKEPAVIGRAHHPSAPVRTVAAGPEGVERPPPHETAAAIQGSLEA